MGKRIVRWDCAKGILIFCVVLGHVANFFRGGSRLTEAVQFWIYLFHMPAFVFISGVFSKHTIAKGRWTRAVSYLLLYGFMKLLMYLVKIYEKGFAKAKLDLLHENNAPWFALAMCWFLLITMLVRRVRPWIVLTVSIAAAAAAGYLSVPRGSFLAFARTVSFFPFFYCGYLVNPENMERFLCKKAAGILGAAFLLVSFGYVYLDLERVEIWRKLFRARYSYRQISKTYWLLGGGWRLGALLVSAAFIPALLAAVPKRRGSLSRLGERTLAVYALHFPLMTLLLRDVPGVNDWIAGRFTFPKCMAVSFLLTGFLSLPIWERLLRVLMEWPEWGWRFMIGELPERRSK